MIWLYNSRIIAVFAVVCLHVASGVVVWNEIGSEYWWVGNIYVSAAKWCVPVFVMISGASLLDHSKNEPLFHFYRKRLARVLIPILFWSAFFLLWDYFKGALKGSHPPVSELLIRLFTGVPCYHMWFLYMIIGLYLFTPFFRKVVASSTQKEMMFLVIAAFTLAAFNQAFSFFYGAEAILFINWFLLYIPFFFTGYLIRESMKQPPRSFLWAGLAFSVGLTCLGYYFGKIKISLEAGEYFYGYLSIFIIPMSISVMYLLKTWNRPLVSAKFSSKLASFTLGIYLIHPLIIDIITYAGYGAMSFNPVLSIPVIGSIVFIISLALSYTISHIPYLNRII